MSLRFAYSLTESDFKEFVRVRPRVKGLEANRKLLVLIVIASIACVVLVNVLTPNNPPPTPAPTTLPGPPPNLLLNIALPFLPWLCLIAFFYFFVFRRLRRRQSLLWQANHLSHQPHTLQADDRQLIITTPLSASRYDWPAFTAWKETPTVFALYLSPLSGYVIPTRAFPSDTDLIAFRTLLQSHIRPPGSPAFPL